MKNTDFWMIQVHNIDSRWELKRTETMQTLSAAMGMGGGNLPLVAIRERAKKFHYWNGDQVTKTLTCRNAGGDQRMPDIGQFNCLIEEMEMNEYVVRRLTPLECCRLQGFPDGWSEIDKKEDFTDEEYRFWLDVRNTHARVNGRQEKEYTKKQMLHWYNKLHSDSAEYKMWGNGIALPNALYVMEGIVSVMTEGNKCD